MQDRGRLGELRQEVRRAVGVRTGRCTRQERHQQRRRLAVRTVRVGREHPGRRDARAFEQGERGHLAGDVEVGVVVLPVRAQPAA